MEVLASVMTTARLLLIEMKQIEKHQCLRERGKKATAETKIFSRLFPISFALTGCVEVEICLQ